MKINNSYIIPFVSFLLVSCGRKESKKPDQDATNTVKLVRTAKDVQENQSSLANETPLTKEEFESWLPGTLLGMPLTSSTINMLPEIGSCSATYSVKNRRIRVMVIDGAGEKGNNAVSSYRMSSIMEYDEKGTWGSTKTTTISGIKVKESSLKNGKFNLSMFYNNRFAVDVETNEVGHEELEQLVKELNLEQIK